MISINKLPLFQPGRIVATPAALEALNEAGQTVWEFMALHLAGDWGVVDELDKLANDEALKDGSRLLSAYNLKNGTKIWVITEAESDNGQRESTTVLLPDEY